MKIKVLLLTTLSMLIVSSVQAADWPQYLGPNRDSTSPETGLLRTWPENGPAVLWTVPVGIGYGGPAIKDGQVYLLDRDDAVGDILRCLDLSNGKELWRFAYDAPGRFSFPGSRSVPAVDEEHVYSCGPYGDLYAVDLETHKPVWHKNIWTDFGGDKIPMWAITQNPLLYGDLVILASQAPEAGVVAYEKSTGNLKWKTPSLGLTGYVSPSVVTIDGQDHVVMITAAGRGGEQMGKVVGIEPLTGKILWQYDNWKCHLPVPSAVDAGDNKVLVVGGYELGATMIKVDKQDDGSYAASEVFTTEEFGGQTKPPILYEGNFYGQYGTNNRRDGLVCMSMDGTIRWKTEQSPDFNKGSMILADGLILATDGTTALYLIEPDPTGFKPLASAPLLAEGGDDGGGSNQNWAPIALSDGKVLIRDQKRMMCVQVAK